MRPEQLAPLLGKVGLGLGLELANPNPNPNPNSNPSPSPNPNPNLGEVTDTELRRRVRELPTEVEERLAPPAHEGAPG